MINPYESPDGNANVANTVDVANEKTSFLQRLIFAVYSIVVGGLFVPITFFLSLGVLGVPCNWSNVAVVLGLVLVMLFVLYRSRTSILHRRLSSTTNFVIACCFGGLVGISVSQIAILTLFNELPI